MSSQTHHACTDIISCVHRHIMRAQTIHASTVLVRAFINNIPCALLPVRDKTTSLVRALAIERC